MILSTKLKRKLRRTYPITTKPYLLDNKELRFATPNPDAGKACKSCWFYHLQVELEDGQIPPDYREIELEEDKKPYRSKEPILEGFCVLCHPILITNINPNYGCPYHMEKAKELQFKDDVIGESIIL